MTSCSSCNAKKKNHIEIYVKNLNFVNNVYINEILKYVNTSNVFIFHTTTDGKDHMICNECFETLKNRANMFDTNIVSCPVCPRMMFI